MARRRSRRASLAPFVVLWATIDPQSFGRSQLRATGAVVVAAIAVGVVAYSPLIAQTTYRDALGFLAILPLLWAALRCDQRATATVAVILSCFALWGTLVGGGPFTRDSLNDSFLMLVMFLISISVPGLALSADVAMRRRSEENLRRARGELELISHQLRDATATLQESHADTRKESRTAHPRDRGKKPSACGCEHLKVALHGGGEPRLAPAPACLGLFVEQLRGRVSAVERRQLVERMDAAVTTMDELFAALLDISKLDLGVLVPNISEFSIADALEKIDSTFSGAADKKGITLRTVPSSSWVRSDPILLERILLNLVSNAVRYTTRGGVVVGCRRHGGLLRIEVWDSGAGIPDDQRQNIFAEFCQLAASKTDHHAGLGLGLSIVDRLCRLLEHPIELKSMVGKGSCFAVAVPVATVPARAVEVPDSREPELDAFKGKLIVVIDDDAMVLSSTDGLLRSWGCRVVTAGSGDAALAGLAEHDCAPISSFPTITCPTVKPAWKRLRICAQRSTHRSPPFSSAATQMRNRCARLGWRAIICCTSRFVQWRYETCCIDTCAGLIVADAPW